MNVSKTHRTISLSSVDPDLLTEVEAIVGEETPKICFQCNMCSSGCPVVDYMEYPPHMIMQMTRLGLTEDLLSSQAIWTCTLCLKCKERCPQQTSAVDTIWALRTLAIQKGYIVPEAYEVITKQLTETGLIFELSELIGEDREDLELPDLPHPDQAAYQAMLAKT